MHYFVILSLIRLTDCAMEPFIVNGKAAAIEQFPHSAFMSIMCKLKDRKDPVPWICGASIINERITMTAAHCLATCTKDSYVSVSVGHKQRDRGIVTTILVYYIHDKYNPTIVSNDIALMRLTIALEFSDSVQRVALMVSPPYNEKAQIAGWGIIDEDTQTVGDVLSYINQFVWNTEECKKRISKLPKGTICASSGEGSSYSSRGDSGSALVVRGYIQIGIVSYKMPRVSRSLVVYTDTGYFYDWIRKNSKRLYCA